jgi:hypothetical protein
MIFAIPSYNRYTTIFKHSISFLLNQNVERKNIFVFVANQQQYNFYREYIGNDIHIVIGKLGIANQRNFIRYYFNPLDEIIVLDDDILRYVSLNNSISFLDFCREQFTICKTQGIYLWGAYPISFFLKETETNNKLVFIIGSFYGMINSHSRDLDISDNAECKEDIEMSILHFKKYGKIRRVNWCSVVKSKQKKGGLFCIDRTTVNHNSAMYLFNKYREYIDNIYERKGYTEVKLRSITSNVDQLQMEEKC